MNPISWPYNNVELSIKIRNKDDAAFSISNSWQHYFWIGFNFWTKNGFNRKNYKRLLLVTDAGILQQQLHQLILEILKQLQLDYAISLKCAQADLPQNRLC